MTRHCGRLRRSRRCRTSARRRGVRSFVGNLWLHASMCFSCECRAWSAPVLRRMLSVLQHAPPGSCLKVLGVCVHLDGGHKEQVKSTLASAWNSYHNKVPLWRARGSWKSKVQALRLAIFLVLAWCSGSRRWTSEELRSARTMQIRITHRIAKMWPKTGEDFPASAGRTSRWSGTLWAEAGVLSWDAALTTVCWGWAGHLARLGGREPDRCCVRATSWRDAWWRTAVKSLNHTTAEMGRLRASAEGTATWASGSETNRFSNTPSKRVEAKNHAGHWPWTVLGGEAWNHPSLRASHNKSYCDAGLPFHVRRCTGRGRCELKN